MGRGLEDPAAISSFSLSLSYIFVQNTKLLSRNALKEQKHMCHPSKQIFTAGMYLYTF